MTLFHSIAVSVNVPLGILPLMSEEGLERVSEYGGVVPKLTEDILCESICNAYEAVALNHHVLSVIFSEYLNSKMESMIAEIDIRGFRARVYYSFKVLRNGMMYVDDVRIANE